MSMISPDSVGQENTSASGETHEEWSSGKLYVDSWRFEEDLEWNWRLWRFWRLWDLCGFTTRLWLWGLWGFVMRLWIWDLLPWDGRCWMGLLWVVLMYWDVMSSVGMSREERMRVDNEHFEEELDGCCFSCWHWQ